MSYMTNGLIKRGHSWSVRYVVPRAWRVLVGKDAIARALGTRDLDEARRRKHGALAKIVAECEALVYGNDRAEVERAKAKGEDEYDAITGIVADKAHEIEAREGEEAAHTYADVVLRGAVTLRKAANAWLASQEGKVTKGTVDGRRRVTKEFIKAVGNIPLSKVTPRVATGWLSEHLEPSGRSPKTLGRYLSSMDLMWRWCRRREWCAGLSPFEGLTSELQKIKSRKRAFTDDEMQTFIDALKAKSNKHPEEYDVGVLLLESSARLNEIAELRVRDVGDGGEVRIVDGKTASANRCLFFFSGRALAILRRRRGGKEPGDQVFQELTPGGQDQKLGHSLSKRMRRTLAEVIPDAKEQGLDLHGIRRWGATVWESLEGIDRTLMKRAFGHTVGDLLGDTYSDGPEKRRLAAAFEAFSMEVQRRVL